MTYLPVLAGAVGLCVASMLTGCGSGSTTSDTSVASESASGAVASADACPQGPPAREPLISGSYGTDGVVGVVVNSTGNPLWVSNAAWPERKYRSEKRKTPCQLAPGDKAAFASWMDAILYVSASPTDLMGTRIYLYDPDVGYPAAAVSGFAEIPGLKVNENKAINCGTKWWDSEHTFSEGESWDYEASNGAGYSGKVNVVRLPDDEEAANTYTGQTRMTDDWARMDVTVFALGYCS